MKKLLYTLLIAFATTLAVSSCTEEQVTPNLEYYNGGGGAIDPPQK